MLIFSHFHEFDIDRRDELIFSLHRRKIYETQKIKIKHKNDININNRHLYLSKNNKIFIYYFRFIF